MWKVSKYGVFSGLCFTVVGMNAEIYGVNPCIKIATGKYGPEKTPHLDTFHVFHEQQQADNESKSFQTFIMGKINNSSC